MGWEGKHPSGTFISSNRLVSHQTHKNEQFDDVKWSKILFNCIRDSRIAKKFEFFKIFNLPHTAANSLKGINVIR